MSLPCRWREGDLADFAGRVRFLRRFGQPRQIDPHEHVWLTFPGVEGHLDAWLNGQPLVLPAAKGRSHEFEITPFLRPRNELVVEIESPMDQGGLWGEVALEIRCAAFLRKVRSSLLGEGEARRLQLRGEVAGEHDGPLELYGLLNNATVIYTQVRSAPRGQPFEVLSEPLSIESAGPHMARVDLVLGAVCWYTIEQVLDGDV
jgi:hypothetical protein